MEIAMRLVLYDTAEEVIVGEDPDPLDLDHIDALATRLLDRLPPAGT